MSVNKWFKKQYRTSEDAWLDEMNPARVGTPPIDTDIDDSNEVSFAPAGSHGRPLKGGYWFIRKSHREKVQEAINRDRERMRHAPTFVFRRSMSDGENHCSADFAPSISSPAEFAAVDVCQGESLLDGANSSITATTAVHRSRVDI